MGDRLKTGKAGEEIAVNFLRNRNYKIIERNFKRLGGEIDIIAEKDNMIIMVEVKSKSADSNFFPEENVTDAKIEKILNTFDIFLSENPEFEKYDPQIDIMVVTVGENPKVNHFENILID